MDDHIYEVHFNHLQSTVNDIRNDIMKNNEVLLIYVLIITLYIYR
jgi:hypothetical protein